MAGGRRGCTSYQRLPSVLMATPSKSAPPLNGLEGGACDSSKYTLPRKVSTISSCAEQSSVSVASLRALLPLTELSIIMEYWPKAGMVAARVRHVPVPDSVQG